TEDGSYSLNGATLSDALNIVTRKGTATWVIPTENEWYKAAYYIAGTGSYYKYTTSSNTVPTSAPPGSTLNIANFLHAAKGYAVTGSTNYDSNQNYLTDVGAYTASASPYGAFDMGGDVEQWNESLTDLFGITYRGVRGGSWDDTSDGLASSNTDFGV